MIGDGLLAGYRQITGCAGELRRQILLPPGIHRKLRPDGILKIRRHLGFDGQDFRKAKLADYLHQRAAAINTAVFMRKHRKTSFLQYVVFYILYPIPEKMASMESAMALWQL
jgi:hypothetical protein